MKKFLLIITILVVLVLAGCTLPAPSNGPSPAGGSPTATGNPPASGDDSQKPAPTALPAGGESTGGDKPAPSPTAPPASTSTQPAPTATSQSVAAAATATTAPATQLPTKTTFPAKAFDPASVYGKPQYENKMEYANFSEWARPETSTLPDDQNIRLVFKDGKLYVTGKILEFSTWWFSYHSLNDFYAEMTFDSETCSGGDAYGMIVRGPEHKAGVSYGYVVSFTCDGHLWVYRLNGVDPWDAKELINETKDDHINAGSNKQNVMGVRADGNTLTIVANGYEIAQVKDDAFAKGRIGVFVRPANTANYTYRLTKFVYWELNKEK